MATVSRFEDLQIWQKARCFSNAIDDVTDENPFRLDYDHRRQIRRAADSIMDNIAEGFGRGGRGEFIQFLTVSKGSVNEAKSQLYRALDRRYLDAERFETLYRLADELGKMIDSLALYLQKSEIKGLKYKNRLPENRKTEN
jgi:four helix bundle protein